MSNNRTPLRILVMLLVCSLFIGGIAHAQSVTELRQKMDDARKFVKLEFKQLFYVWSIKTFILYRKGSLMKKFLVSQNCTFCYNVDDGSSQCCEHRYEDRIRAAA